MIRLLIWILSGYVLFKFLIDFVFPASTAGKEINNKIKNIEKKQNIMFKEQESLKKKQNESSYQSKQDDYIDFEEIKD